MSRNKFYAIAGVALIAVLALLLIYSDEIIVMMLDAGDLGISRLGM